MCLLIGSEVLWAGTLEGIMMQRDFLSFNCEFQHVQRILNGHCRPQLDTSRIATKGEIKLKIFSGKLFTYFGMRWGFNEGVCQNYGRLGCDAVYSGKRVEEFRRNFPMTTTALMELKEIMTVSEESITSSY